MPSLSDNQLSMAIQQNVTFALQEDIASGDLSAELIPSQEITNATLICRENAVLCGTQWVEACFKALDNDCRIHWYYQDGDVLAPNSTVCHIVGKARALLTAERSALNFLQTLSGTATLTRQYVNILTAQNIPTQIVDTRKTLPGLRIAQKYAVRVGGGTNHRLGLFDAILIKENHILAAGSITNALKNLQHVANNAKFIQVEVETLTELEEALCAGANMILLDNMSIQDIQKAVQLNQNQALLEVSGNVNASQLTELAATGIDRISIGALTKNIQSIDFSLRFSI